MRFFDKIFGTKEETEYKATLVQISNPLMDKIDGLDEKEVRGFFKVILDAAEKSLRGILFMAPSDLDFETPPAERAKQDKNYWEKQMKEKSAFYKKLTAEEIDFWLRKVSLALMAYSYHFFSGGEEIPFVQFSYEAYWQRMFNSYNEIFGENITKKDINHYAAGLKEDAEKGYSKSGNIEKTLELTAKDYKIIGTELLQKIWKEGAAPNEKKVLFLGTRIWQAYQQIVQPFLPKLLTE